MREIPLSAEPREGVGKGAARRIRTSGRIPAVVYGPETKPVSVAVGERLFHAAMKDAGTSSIINLNVAGKESKVVLREIQRDPVTNRILHLDFHAISMTKPLYISIPIHFVGTPRGVKTDGGIMQATMRELEISCLPTDIPEHFELDVADLGIGDSIHVSDISIPNTDIRSEGQRTVVVISAPTVIKEVVEAAEGEEVEGEAAAEEAPAEGEAAKEGDAPSAEAEKAKPEEKK